MIKEPRNLLWILPLIGLVSFPLWQPIAAKLLRPPGVAKKAAASLSAASATRNAEMLQVDFMQSKAGSREWQIKASRMYSQDSEKEIELEDIEAFFYGDPGNDAPRTKIRSRRASYDADKQFLNLREKVVINDHRGHEIQTESLNYLGMEKKIKSAAEVHITGSNISVSGDSLMYDIASGNYRLDGNVVCKVW